MGYNDYNSETMSVEDEDLDLGRISLEEKSSNIKGVVIAGTRKASYPKWKGQNNLQRRF